VFWNRGTVAANGLERLEELLLKVLIGWMTGARPAGRRFYRPGT